METKGVKGMAVETMYLETFLVEWKPRAAVGRYLRVSVLETFLVEWKPA